MTTEVRAGFLFGNRESGMETFRIPDVRHAIRILTLFFLDRSLSTIHSLRSLKTEQSWMNRGVSND